MPVPKKGVTQAFFSTITDFLLKLFIYFSFIHFMSRLKRFDNVFKNAHLYNHTSICKRCFGHYYKDYNV